MAFTQFHDQQVVVELLQRSLDKGRLAHAYLFTGNHLDELEGVARMLAKALNCQNPPRRGESGLPVDCCDHCLSCRKIDGENHADVQWIRPEMKSRIISVAQMRDLIQTVHLKPSEATFKIAILSGVDRLKTEGANAFLKTLEEPPSNSILILLSTEPSRILETILSRCLRLNFAGSGQLKWDEAIRAWIGQFATQAAAGNKSLLGRYKLLSVLTREMAAMKETVKEQLTARSLIQQYQDVERDLVEKWEAELSAAIEAEYRRRRQEFLLALEWWLRDIWLQTMGVNRELLAFPELGDQAAAVASRVKAEEAVDNLASIESTQRMLHTNAQEALVLEVGLLKLKL